MDIETQRDDSRQRSVNRSLAELRRIEDDRCVEVWAQFSDQEAWDAFWKYRP